MMDKKREASIYQPLPQTTSPFYVMVGQTSRYPLGSCLQGTEC